MRADTLDRFRELAETELQSTRAAEQLLVVGVWSRQMNEAPGEFADAAFQFFEPSRGQGAVGHPVVRVTERKDDRSLALTAQMVVEAGELDRALAALGASQGEESLLDARRS